ncbi:MAG TPA: hypothetical protein ENJ37_02020 [Deltaproteobacteria bacterium]|nr:hypothetical protein [Deltaproteobacteria bacterium]
MKPYDITVIGAGSGGLVVAAAAAQLGARVALVEKDRMGGECLNTGCVPSKALVHAARTVRTAAGAARFCAAPPELRLDYGRVADYIRSAIAAIEPHDSAERFRSLGCDVVMGAARFVSDREIEVEGRRIESRSFVVATGSSPLVPDIEGLRGLDVLTNENVFELRELPPSLVVLGAGPVAVELGQAMARLGSKVTILQRSAHILSREDRDVRLKMEEILRAEGLDIITGAALRRFEADGPAKVVFYERDGEERSLRADALLCALGRVPNTGGLDLHAAGVDFDEKGITVDERLRTSRPHIYACGDVTGPYRFTHMAAYQAGVIVRNAVFRLPAKVDYRTVPWVIFTDPEAARVGMTEEQARAADPKVRVYSFPFKDNDRAVTDDSTGGFVKLLCNGRGHIMGAHIVGPHAGELLAQITLAMRTGLTVDDIAATIHPYPTLSEAVKQAASLRMKSSLTPLRKKILKFLFRLHGED